MAIPMFDFKLKEIIENHLSQLKQNLNMFDQIFGGLSDDTLNRLKTYFQTRDIRVRLSYPTDQNYVPCYCIRLGSEDQLNRFLGNYVDDDETYVKVEDVTEDLRISLVDGHYVVKTNKRPIHQVNSIVYNGVEFYEDVDFSVVDPQRGLISLHFPVDPSVDTLTIQYERQIEGEELKGYLTQSTYVIESWATNPEETVLLHHIMKWIMEISQDDFYDIGIYNSKVSGQDLEPIVEYAPNFVFRRAFVLTIQYEVTVDHPSFGFINDVIVEDESG